MKGETRAQHFENLKRHFRSTMKQQNYDYLVTQLWDIRRALDKSASDFRALENERRRLKKDYKAIQSLMMEYK